MLIPLVVLSATSPPTEGGCPERETVLEQLDGIDLDAGFRARVIGLRSDPKLIAKALDRRGKVTARREGKVVHAVVVAELPPESLWRAIGDEEHFDDVGVMPLDGSAIVARDGSSRLVYQFARAMGTGRWWVSEIDVDRDLYASSLGALWEAYWSDPAVDPSLAGVEGGEQSERLPRLESSRGAWLVVPLAERCVLLDYVVRTEPGGFMGFAQWLVATRAVKRAARGILITAREHVPSCDAAARTSLPGGDDSPRAGDGKSETPGSALRTPGLRPGRQGTSSRKGFSGPSDRAMRANQGHAAPEAAIPGSRGAI